MKAVRLCFVCWEQKKEASWEKFVWGSSIKDRQRVERTKNKFKFVWIRESCLHSPALTSYWAWKAQKKSDLAFRLNFSRMNANNFPPRSVTWTSFFRYDRTRKFGRMLIALHKSVRKRKKITWKVCPGPAPAPKFCENYRTNYWVIVEVCEWSRKWSVTRIAVGWMKPALNDEEGNQ